MQRERRDRADQNNDRERADRPGVQRHRHPPRAEQEGQRRAAEQHAHAVTSAAPYFMQQRHRLHRIDRHGYRAEHPRALDRTISPDARASPAGRFRPRPAGWTAPQCPVAGGGCGPIGPPGSGTGERYSSTVAVPALEYVIAEKYVYWHMLCPARQTPDAGGVLLRCGTPAFRPAASTAAAGSRWPTTGAPETSHPVGTPFACSRNQPQAPESPQKIPPVSVSSTPRSILSASQFSSLKKDLLCRSQEALFGFTLLQD